METLARKKMPGKTIAGVAGGESLCQKAMAGKTTTGKTA
jgi:hypothetical protein